MEKNATDAVTATRKDDIKIFFIYFPPYLRNVFYPFYHVKYHVPFSIIISPLINNVTVTYDYYLLYPIFPTVKNRQNILKLHLVNKLFTIDNSRKIL
jgi:hypothetical protein